MISTVHLTYYVLYAVLCFLYRISSVYLLLCRISSAVGIFQQNSELIVF